MFVRDCIYTTLVPCLNALRHVARSTRDTSPVTRTAADVPPAMNGAKRSILRRAGPGPRAGRSRQCRHASTVSQSCLATVVKRTLQRDCEWTPLRRAFAAAVCCMQIDNEWLRDTSEPQAVASTLSRAQNLSLRASCIVDQLFDSDTTIPRDMLRRYLKCFQWLTANRLSLPRAETCLINFYLFNHFLLYQTICSARTVKKNLNRITIWTRSRITETCSIQIHSRTVTINMCLKLSQYII